jgi:hypothetical protein
MVKLSISENIENITLKELALVTKVMTILKKKLINITSGTLVKYSEELQDGSMEK